MYGLGILKILDKKNEFKEFVRQKKERKMFFFSFLIYFKDITHIILIEWYLMEKMNRLG